MLHSVRKEILGLGPLLNYCEANSRMPKMTLARETKRGRLLPLVFFGVGILGILA